jgi:hypothetical protein
LKEIRAFFVKRSKVSNNHRPEPTIHTLLSGQPKTPGRSTELDEEA